MTRVKTKIHSMAACFGLASLFESAQDVRMKADLQTMFDEDQEHLWSHDKEFVNQMVERHTERLKEYLQTRSWADIQNLGWKAESQACVLTQHAVHDSIFQYRILEEMKSLKADGYPSLHDAIAIHEGRRPRFGLYYNQDGTMIPVEDPENLNHIRQEVGLPAIAEQERTSRENKSQLGSCDLN